MPVHAVIIEFKNLKILKNMDILTLFFILFVHCVGCVISEVNLRFVFIIEAPEVELTQHISRSISSIENSRSGIKISDEIIFLNRENEEEAYRQLCAALSHGISSIIDLSWSPWDLAGQLAYSSGIPLVRSKIGSQQLVTALDNYLEIRNATDAALIVESEVEVDQTLYELLSESNVRIWVHAGLNKDAVTALKTMRPDPSFYAIIGSTTFVTETYRRAVKVKLVRRELRWNLVFTDYQRSSFDTSQIILPTILLSVDEKQCCDLLGREPCSCSGDFKRQQYIISSITAHLTDIISKLDIDRRTIIQGDCEKANINSNGTRDAVYRILNEVSENNNDSLLYWDEASSGLYLRSKFLLSTYIPDSGIQNTAAWTAGNPFTLLSDVTLEPVKLFFRVGTTAAIPWSMPKRDPETGQLMYNEDGQSLYEGYCIDLIQKMSEVMNFDYEIITPKVGTFGMKLPNGTWDGVVGDLMRGETDFAIAALTMTAEREEVIDFVAPYFEQTGILISIRKPIRKTSLFKFMTVLRTEVWLSIVAALILTGFMIWLLDKYSPYSARNNPEAYPYPCREFTLKESFWFALTSFTPQGGGEAPKALSGRTLVAAYWLFVVLMLATFTANLAAFLTVERMQTPVSSLEQLARQSRINYTVVEGSTIHQYFINMKFAEDTLYRVWKEITLNATSDQAQYRVWDYPIREQYGHILLAINASGPVVDAAAGFREVNEHTDADFAFIHDAAEIRYEVTRNCNLTEVGELFAEQPYAIAVQQGSRLQEDLSRALLDLQKERFLEELSAKYWNETAKQMCPDADESEGITLESLGGVFIATLFGLGLAMLTLAWEVFYYKRKEKNKIKTLEAPEKPKIAFDAPKKNLLESKITENVKKLRKRGKNKEKLEETKNVTFGSSFKPAIDKSGVSYISVFPKSGYNP